MQLAFPALRKQHAFRQSSPVKKAMFVMDNVVNAVGRHDVTGFINRLSQGLPPSRLPVPDEANLMFDASLGNSGCSLGIFYARQAIGAIRCFRWGPR